MKKIVAIILVVIMGFVLLSGFTASEDISNGRNENNSHNTSAIQIYSTDSEKEN
ncbi:MAG: hypothetical protein IJ289_03850 [Clostridia bacterium]|nr:hypothetical protein [Clostridia bacterium]